MLLLLLAAAGMTSIISKYRAFLGVGSNLGVRYRNIVQGLEQLCQDGNHTSLRRTSFFYETAPMYVEDQPSFLNAAVEVETTLEPHALLQRLKEIEHDLGRNFSEIRNGPRPLDLDILLYHHHADNKSGSGNDHGRSIDFQAPYLTIPHPRIAERDFVLRPLCDITGRDYILTTNNASSKRETNDHDQVTTLGQWIDQSPPTETPPVRVLPLPRNRMIAFRQTIIMGILNVTPDSFSDGGQFDKSLERAVDHALQMEKDGASIIDIGGESTRPGAKEVAIQEEWQRTVPVIQRIRQVSDIPISIDTRHSAVARAAIEAGADIVNDVSGGLHDPEMLPTVAKLGVPMVLMHMRGTPQTMQSMTRYDNGVVQDVAKRLKERMEAAEAAGIPRWLQVVDPGIGFAKDMAGNLSLLKNLRTIRSMVEDAPMLLGTSRKGFIGRITGLEKAADRDFGTVASMVGPLCLEGQAVTPTILRVHNVKATAEAVKIMDAIKQAPS